jgi:hypothetical protein
MKVGRIEEEMTRKGRDRGCRETNMKYQKNKMSLGYCSMEDGIRG